MMLYKGKGSLLHEPNNCCGICLKDISKIISAILVNSKLLKNLETMKDGMNQFGHMDAKNPYMPLFNINSKKTAWTPNIPICLPSQSLQHCEPLPPPLHASHTDINEQD